MFFVVKDCRTTVYYEILLGIRSYYENVQQVKGRDYYDGVKDAIGSFELAFVTVVSRCFFLLQVNFLISLNQKDYFKI